MAQHFALFGLPAKRFAANKHDAGNSHFIVRTRTKSMSKPQDRTVSRRPDGKWENKRNDADRASSVHDTQREANEAAKEMLQNQGGGERTTKGLDGKIVSKDTIAPGNDPNPPRDREH